MLAFRWTGPPAAGIFAGLTPSKQISSTVARWRFTRAERIWLSISLLVILAFGANLEQRTALRRAPMTDLGVFSCAAWAVHHGDNVYRITDWHGWHYHYPPALAILFRPLEHPLPRPCRNWRQGCRVN